MSHTALAANQSPPSERERPPRALVGPWAWLRANLFNSWLSTATTLVLLYLILRFAISFIDWAFLHAIWSVPYGPKGMPDTSSCQNAKGTGACWAIIADKYRLILFGRFPYEEQWRPAIVVLLFIMLYVCSAIRGFWRRGITSKVVTGVALVGAALIALDVLLSLVLTVIYQALGLSLADWPTGLFQVLGVLDVAGRYALVIAVTLAWPAIGVWISTLAVIGVLMWGGVLGLMPVPVDFWGGLPITLILATFGLAFAFPLSILVALGRRSTRLPAVKLLCVLYVELIRGVPLISVLFMASVMFPLFMPPGVNIDKLLRAQIAVILFAGAYLAEVVRGGLQALPKGQSEAADALGLSYWQKTGLIILPQALRLVIPPLVNTFIGFFKDTSLVLIIGLFDLLTMGKIALSDPPWQSFSTEVYITLAIIYIMFCYAMSRYSRGLERDLNRAQRR
jgi:His/Glu/Gln/Arg/opine family amino acid ABC transporter permease subunit